PISQLELLEKYSATELINQVESFLVYGSYPDVISQPTYAEKENMLRQLSNSYLLKDILEYSGIKNSDKILSILKLLAFQVGSEVSTVEIANKVEIDSKTVAKFLDLFEKSFVIFRLGGFSRNLRKEVSKMSKYYFYDTGIRNALISNFNKLEDRDDVGLLWENFVMIERRKRNSYLKTSQNYYFWRTYDQKEIDLVEEHGGGLHGFEFKWQLKRSRPPKLWHETYSNATYIEINKENYLDFIAIK
ncbi:MAG: DUF4143 domain-containing protein, partial [bacterium]|nr:DUF4143 domain-containing protein [bacterium]